MNHTATCNMNWHILASLPTGVKTKVDVTVEMVIYVPTVGIDNIIS